MKNCWRNIRFGITNFIRWFRIIWNDRDWDSAYLLDIIKFKMERMEQDFITFPYCAPSGTKELRICILLLERLVLDNYRGTEFDKLDEKWGEIVFGLSPTGSCMYRKNEHTKEDSKQYHKETMRLFDDEALLRKQDIELFLKLFSRHYRSWWT